MAALNYTTLISTVGSRLNRSDLDDLVPDFITRAEEEIFAKLAANPIRPMEKIYTISTSDSSVAMPSDFIDAIKLKASDGTNSWTLSRLAPADLNEEGFYATRALPYREEYNSSRVQYYSVTNTTLMLSATPSSALTLTMHCYGKPEALNTGNSTNWLIENHSNVYEFGTLAHAARHIWDNEMMAQNIELFEAAMERMLMAYPETIPSTELRATDAPWAARAWSITNG